MISEIAEVVGETETRVDIDCLDERVNNDEKKKRQKCIALDSRRLLKNFGHCQINAVSRQNQKKRDRGEDIAGLIISPENIK